MVPFPAEQLRSPGVVRHEGHVLPHNPLDALLKRLHDSPSRKAAPSRPARVRLPCREPARATTRRDSRSQATAEQDVA